MVFEEFVAQRAPALLRLATALTADPQQAEDLLQTTLEQVYRRWRRVAAADSPEAYARRMLVNAHLSARRRRSSTERPRPLDDAAAGGPAAGLDGTAAARPGPDPADEVAAHDHTRRLLAGLAPRARAVLVLRYYADLDDAAIAHALGVRPGTVRGTASRALATLREHLAEQHRMEASR